MSSARFARSGRARYFLCFLALVLMLGMVAIFHNTTRQLDQTREQQLQCEQQQQTINEQLSTVIKQKFTMQKNFEAERSELMQTKLNLEQKLKKNSDQLATDKLESHVQLEKLQQAHKLLQSEHKKLGDDCSKSKQQHMEEVNAFNQKLQDLMSKTQKEQNVLNSEIVMLKEKYNTDTVDNRSRLLQLEHIMNEYQAHCSYQPKAVSSLAHLQINKPIDIPQILSANSSPQTAEQKKSFSQQVRVGFGRYNINLNTNQNITELTVKSETLNTTSTVIGGGTRTTTTISLPFVERQNRSLLLNSVENFQILPKMLSKIKPETQTIDKIASPLGSPHKLTSLESNSLVTNSSHIAVQSPLSSTSSLPPLPKPPQQAEQQQQHQSRKLPENVAPIPDNFEALFKNEEHQRIEDKTIVANKQVVETQGAANVPDKAEKVAKTDDGNNNRYANVVNDLGSNVKQDNANAAYMNANDFNVPVNNEDENNFFQAAESKNIANAASNVVNSDNNNQQHDGQGEPLPEAGDIEVKQNKSKLNADNVNNEVLNDQGKVFDDGLRLEEGMEEDADEDDDYSNLARQNGEQAIRN